MRKDINDFDQVILVGLGGTGSHLAEPLAKLLSYSRNTTNNIMFVDGDLFEPSNQNRQMCNLSDEGANKAEVFQKRTKHLVHSTAFKTYVGKKQLKSIVNLTFSSSPMFILCVDNHMTRKESLEACEELSDFIWISPGNELTDGEVITWIRRGGKDIVGIDPRLLYAGVNNPEDHIPGTGSCTERSIKETQLIGTNMMAACLTLNTVQSIIYNDLPNREVSFDTVQFTLKTL